VLNGFAAIRGLIGAVLLAASVAVAAGATPPAPARVEFWTIAANEGTSSGGHAALRIDDVVHHLEHRGDGLIRDRRDPRLAFEAAYRGRDNRRIEVLRFDLSPSRAQALDALLRERVASRDLRLDTLEAIDEEIRWLDRGIDQGFLEIAVPGLGLFSADAPGCTPGSRGLPSGVSTEALEAARNHAREARTAALGEATSDTLWSDSAYRRLLETTQLLAALDAVALCQPVREDAFSYPAPLGVVSHEERAAWRAITGRLEDALARLVESRRPDRGLALALTWGRLQAARATLDSGRTILLDAFAEARDAPVPLGPMPAGALEHRRARAEARLLGADRTLVDEAQGRHLEPSLDGLERIAHDVAHARQKTRHGRPHPIGALEASRALDRPSARVALPWPGHATLDALRERRRRLVMRRAAVRAGLEADLAYDLVRRNCVTELLTALRAARILDSPAAHPAEFAPVIAQARLERQLDTQIGAPRPSARQALLRGALEAVPSTSARLGVLVRESNTLTSHFYHAHADDSAFLFFADGPLPTRPLAGVANLAWGTGASLIGLFTAPFDRGERLGRGLRGVTMSFPELVFLPIRKGSYPAAVPLDDPG